jgi:diadenylate cyclase
MELWQRLESLWRGGAVAFAEILLLFVVLYAVFRFLRGSRGAAVLRGVLLLIGLSIGIVFLAASMLRLERITWVFEKLSALFVVALIIIFQPELRRGLLRLGLNPFFRRFVRASSPAIDEIVEAAATMSAGKIGAIIAIQREIPLTPYVEAATPLNAEISSELLRTIFHRDTPLHDGAVVIQGNRIAGAGCLLPLTENPELSKSLGTRHRAALGLSEETDAVTVVVSEETGRIALGVDGKLRAGLTVEELRAQLTQLCLEAIEGGEQ